MASHKQESSLRRISTSSSDFLKDSTTKNGREQTASPARTPEECTEKEKKKKRKKAFLAPSVEETCRTQGYNLIKVLGHGSYGSVFLCRSRRRQNFDDAAVKVIDTNKAERIFVEKFLQREIEILLLVRHPFIIHIHSIVYRNQRYYIFMRFAEKGDLFDMISKIGRLDLSKSRIWSAQLASALFYLHSNKIVHRDIKCENILITRHNNIALSDFGFARLISYKNGNNYAYNNAEMADMHLMYGLTPCSGREAQRLHREAYPTLMTPKQSFFATIHHQIYGKPLELMTFCGTKHYASPEIISSRPYDPVKSDIWAFGVVLFIMLTGTMPFLANNQKKIRDYQQKELWKTKVGVSEEIMVILRGVFALDQSRRWDSAQLKEADWFKLGQNSAMKENMRHSSTQFGEEEASKRVFSLRRNQQVQLPSKTDNERSHLMQAPSFMFSGDKVIEELPAE